MSAEIYREKSMARVASPEQLNDYIKVTKPAVWVVLAAIIVLLAGMICWGSFAYIGSYAKGSAEVSKGKMTITFEDENLAKNVEEGMEVKAGDSTGTITRVVYNQKGEVVAEAKTDLEDGTYPATVNYKTTQILGLLFGN